MTKVSASPPLTYVCANVETPTYAVNVVGPTIESTVKILPNAPLGNGANVLILTFPPSW